MIDEGDNPADPEWSYDHEAIVDDVHARTRHPACPVCENEEWLVAGAQNLLVPGMRPDGSYAREQGTPVITWICTNCNYLRMHVAWAPVGDWREGV